LRTSSIVGVAKARTSDPDGATAAARARGAVRSALGADGTARCGKTPPGEASLETNASRSLPSDRHGWRARSPRLSMVAA